MSIFIHAPAVSANEDTLILVTWHKAAGTFIKSGDLICAVETSKAAIDIEAEEEGFLRPLAEAGDTVSVGAPIAALTATPDEDIQIPTESNPQDNKSALPGKPTRRPEDQRRWTLKAAVQAKRLGLDIEEIADRLGSDRVTEADIQVEERRQTKRSSRQDTPIAPENFVSINHPVHDLFEDAHPAQRPERILLLGGGAGAGAMAVDVLTRVPTQRAVGILDGNRDAHGKTVGGVPILGDLDCVDGLWRDGAFDGAIIMFTQDVEERADVFNSLRAKGIPFANIIDPSVDIRGGTQLGVGNLIMANVFFSTAVTIGDNNFFASHTCIEHHSHIGNHCAFGPRTTLSGAVTVGDRVKTGMSVSIEPYVEIGARCLIASGCVITSNIPDASVVKAQRGHTVRPRPGF